MTVSHEDGPIAAYGRLSQRCALVKPGARVAQSDPITRNGSSRASDQPHLHFHVSPSTNTIESGTLPVTFSNTTAKPQGLRRGAKCPTLPC